MSGQERDVVGSARKDAHRADQIAQHRTWKQVWETHLQTLANTGRRVPVPTDDHFGGGTLTLIQEIRGERGNIIRYGYHWDDCQKGHPGHCAEVITSNPWTFAPLPTGAERLLRVRSARLGFLYARNTSLVEAHWSGEGEGQMLTIPLPDVRT